MSSLASTLSCLAPAFLSGSHLPDGSFLQMELETPGRIGLVMGSVEMRDLYPLHVKNGLLIEKPLYWCTRVAKIKDLRLRKLKTRNVFSQNFVG